MSDPDDTDADADANVDDTIDTDRTGGTDGTGGTPRDVASRHERTTNYQTPGPRNSLRYWTRARSPLVVARNYLVIWIVRVSPSLRLKNWLLRRLGTRVGHGASWALESTPDVFWPELITVGEHAIVGYDATILCHEFLQDEYRTGAVVIGDRAMIGAGVVILPGVKIGADARVAANSLVVEDVSPGATVAGVPATER